MKTCYIVGALECNLSTIIKKDGDLIIAADKGFENLKKYNIAPDIVLGDFDSLCYVPELKNTIIHPVRKDDTDTMLSIKYGLSQNFSHFVIYGCIGGRLDQTVASIQSSAFIAENNATSLFINDDYSFTVIKNSGISFDEHNTGKISVFAFGDTAYGVFEKGLSYSLEDGTLTPNNPLGVSNEFTGEKSEIFVKNGKLLIIWETKNNYIREFIND